MRYLIFPVQYQTS